MLPSAAMFYRFIQAACVLFTLLTLLSGCATTTPGKSGPGTDRGDAGRSYGISPVLTPREIPRTDVIARLRRDFSLPELNSALVRKYENRYRRHPEAIEAMLEEAAWSLPYVIDQVQARGFPAEIALLPAIESEYRPAATSASGAAGIWQIVRNTGRHYGLTRSHWKDDWLDLEKSTLAALEYLDSLNCSFDGDWLLSLAAYNTGQGRLRKLIRKARASGKRGQFHELHLPLETRHFVPKLLALRNVIAEPARFGLSLPALPHTNQFSHHPLESRITHRTAAKFCGVNIQVINHLNAENRHGITAPGTANSLRIPNHCSTGFSLAMQNFSGESVTPKNPVYFAKHRVRHGDSLWLIARRYGTTVAAIMETNNLANHQLRVGKSLRIPTESTGRTDKKKSTLVHLVQAGDTLWALAKKYGVSARRIARWNRIAINGTLALGQKLLIFR